MTDVTATDARQRLAELIDDARRSGEPIRITRRGRPIAVILDAATYERLIEDADDAMDRAELRVARDDDEFVPWDEVKADLGLT